MTGGGGNGKLKGWSGGMRIEVIRSICEGGGVDMRMEDIKI